jgi:hypothetical protein
MPVYYFKCPDGGCLGTGRSRITKSAMMAGARLEPMVCIVCGKTMVRAPKPATSNVVETLDNGVMSRRIERPADAERLFKERAAADQDRINNPKL